MLSATSRLLVAGLATLAACGGDLTLPSDPGGGSTPPPPGSPAPTVSATDDRFTTVEGDDHTLTVPAPGVLENDQTDSEAGGLQAAVAQQPLHGTVDLHPDGSLAYTPDGDFFGQDRFTYRATAGATSSAEAEVVIDVLGMNDSPEFVPGPNQVVSQKGGEGGGDEDRHGNPEVEVVNWATNIVPGPANEADQSLQFEVTVLAGERALDGSPSVDPSGTLRFKPGKEPGTAIVEVRLHDDGGTDNGGTDTSESHILSITVTH